MPPIKEVKSGASYAADYHSAAPFPHIVLRNFWDAAMLHEVSQEVKHFELFDGEKDHYGAKKKRYCGSYDQMPPKTKALIDHCSSSEFLRFLEEMTGEQGLVADPDLEGGGIHSLRSGGFVKIHADFNWHERLKLYRRLNLIIYCNEGWQKSWGGAIELWYSDLSKCAVRVFPELNNTVVFTTDDNNLHGHPSPTKCPENVTRDSIALFYYSARRPGDGSRDCRVTTDYYARGLRDVGTIIAQCKSGLASFLSKSKGHIYERLQLRSAYAKEHKP